MDETIPVKNGTTSRWVRILLILSLALNFLIIGTVGGAFMAWSKWSGHHPPRPDMAGGPLTQALSREDRRSIGHEMRKIYGQQDKTWRGPRAQLEELSRDLKAVPFDIAVIEQHLVRYRSVFEKRITLGQDLLLDRLAQMTDEERARYADRLLEVLDRGPRKNRCRDPEK